LVDEAEANSNLATAVTNRLSQNEQCARYTNVLVALAGNDIDAVRGLIAQPLPDAASMPPLPPMQLALPAAVLEYHPTIVSAERDVEAAWADIAVTKADRLPKVELDAALGGQWLSAFGTAYKLIVWSIGPALNGTLYDGGAGSSKVDAARARYREAQANLHAKVRSTVQNVQDALAQQVSADARLVSTQQAQQAAQVALRANEARWRAGALSRFDLETSRRQFEASEESAIAATRDRCLAWVALIQATGYGPSLLAAKLDPSHSGIAQS
jgi:multidrug efflux system outer membrane protein